MIDRLRDTDDQPGDIIVTGWVGNSQYEAKILARSIDQLAELAASRPGRTAQEGAVRVQILAAPMGAR